MICRFPIGWVNNTLIRDVLAALEATDRSWEECCAALASCLTGIVVSYDDAEARERMAKVIGRRLAEAARTGRMPGETVQ